MHAKTETNAKILFLLYPATPSRGVFKILKKNSKNTLQLQMEGYLKILKKKMAWYLASPTCGAFKNFEKKMEKYLASPSCGVQ